MTRRYHHLARRRTQCTPHTENQTHSQAQHGLVSVVGFASDPKRIHVFQVRTEAPRFSLHESSLHLLTSPTRLSTIRFARTQLLDYTTNGTGEPTTVVEAVPGRENGVRHAHAPKASPGLATSRGRRGRRPR